MRIPHPTTKWLLILILATYPLHLAAGQTIYVDVSATGANDGSSWTDAYNYLQDALTTAGSGSEIWVAQGTYKPDANTAHPDGNDSRYATFQLKNGVEIYGGFPTGGGSRDPNTYTTILSGDINVPDDSSDNSYHVVTGSGTDSTAVLDGFTITQGYADGSPPDNRGAGMYNSSGSPTLANCIFYNNSARGYQESHYGGYGSGMYNEGSSPTLTNCTFSNNTIFSQMADGYGAGMYNAGGSPILTDCNFSENNVTGDDSDGYGGAMCNSDSSPNLTKCTFHGNEATSTLYSGYGGGMYNAGGSSNITITNCTFSGNSAGSDYGGFGGGICNVGSSSNVTNCSFSENVATSDGGSLGGGIYNSGGSHTLTDCNFSGNQAEGYEMTGFGGGMYNTGCDPNITNCTFSSNQAQGDFSGNGGGMYNGSSGSPTVTNCTFIDNSASGGKIDSENGGGGMFNASSSSPTVTNCTFIGNSASGNGTGGGGMYNSGSLTVTNCTFIGNSLPSGFGGGGMYNYSGNPTITNCTFSENSASNFGGGMYNRHSNPTITNCAFSGNYSGYSGGGIHNYPTGSPTITNCTLTGNSSDEEGGGICNGSSNISTLTDCILWGNSALIEPQISGSATVSFSDIQGGWTGTGNINVDPCFVTGPDGNYYLSQIASGQPVDSPCVDTGSNASANLWMNAFTTRTDQLPDIGIVDMGYHYPNAFIFGSPDLDGDGNINFVDFAILASQWLQSPGVPSADIAPPPRGDNIVDFLDLGVLADNWPPLWKISEPNLVSLWKFDEGSGMITYDSAGDNDGTIYGATWTTGQIDGALSFDGQDDYVDLGNDSSLKPPLPVTLCAWIKLNTVDGVHGILTLDTSFQNGAHYGVFFLVSNNLVVHYGDGGGIGPLHRRSKIGTTVPVADRWYHVAAVVRGPTDMDLYIDAVNDGGTYIGSGGALAYSSGSSLIGCFVYSTAYYLNGVVDDVRVYDTALTAEEIQQIYQEGLE